MKNKEVMILSASDVMGMNISFNDTYPIIRDALIAHGKKEVMMPPKFGIHPHGGAHCNAMPAYIPGLNALGIKWVSGFPENSNKNLPYIIGTLIINNDQTGAPLAIMEASWITAMRTATVAGLVAETCARKDSKILGIVGAGFQARFCLKAILYAFPKLEQIRIFDIDQATTDLFVSEMGKECDALLFSATSAEDALKPADIMMTATSFVDSPYVKKEWLRRGDTGILVHHRGWENDTFYTANKLIVDDWPQTLAYGMEDGGFYGDLPQCNGELGEILAGTKKGRENSDEIIIGITCGLAIEDMAMGKMIYSMAKEKKIGTYVKFMA